MQGFLFCGPRRFSRDSEFTVRKVRFSSVDLYSHETEVADPCWANESLAGLKPRTEH